MNYSERKKRVLLLNRSIESCKNTTLNLKDELKDIDVKIKNTYDSIKCFTVDYYTAKQGKKRLSELSSKKKSKEKSIKTNIKKMNEFNIELNKLNNNV